MLSLEQVRALEDRVEKAVAYIATIREENAELRRRLGEAEARNGENQSFIDEAAEELAAAEEKANAAEAAAVEARAASATAEAARQAAESRAEAAASRSGQLEAHFRELETKALDLANRAEAAEAKAAEFASRVEEYRRDQSRIEEGIVHALEKLDTFEDLILSQAGTPSSEQPATQEQPPEASIAVKSAPADISAEERTAEDPTPTASEAPEAKPQATGPAEIQLDIF